MPTAARSSSGGSKAVVDESSMLFSLSALTARVMEPRASSTGARGTVKDDSGIIDLKALADSVAPPKPPELSPTLLPEGGLFGAPVTSAPVTGPALGLDATPAPKTRSTAAITVGAVVALAAVVGVLLVLRGGAEKPAVPVAAATATAEVPTAAATATAAPTASVAAAESATASAAPADSAAKAKPRVSGPSRGGGAGVRAAAAAAAAAAPAAAPKPPTASHGNCGCASGDLMCMMKCSAK
jgi:hypothetical protein